MYTSGSTVLRPLVALLRSESGAVDEPERNGALHPRDDERLGAVTLLDHPQARSRNAGSMGST